MWYELSVAQKGVALDCEPFAYLYWELDGCNLGDNISYIEIFAVVSTSIIFFLSFMINVIALWNDVIWNPEVSLPIVMMEGSLCDIGLEP